MTTAKTEQIRLIKAHEHAGKACAPGDSLTVTASEAEWLRNMRIAEPAKTSKEKE
jgi:hypothetical protein